ncbi:MAG: glycosyltransferase [Syntrophorhabdaceae bacterium]|nr:glycosyltransferase [Syntrophorhabdaceae bacterium]
MTGVIYNCKDREIEKYTKEGMLSLGLIEPIITCDYDITSSGGSLNSILKSIKTDLLLLVSAESPVTFKPEGLEKVIERFSSEGVGLVYSDYYVTKGNKKVLYPLNDYQLGSVRDDFDFGWALFFSTSSIKKALGSYGSIPDVEYGALYDIRLKISIDHRIVHIPEPLYEVEEHGEKARPKSLFAYVDPKNRGIQEEMEGIFTEHLKRINAYIPAHRLKQVEESPYEFPVEASVVIPVKDRRKTIQEALGSALCQKTDFPYNIIVVDNHSTDGTSKILQEMADTHDTILHIIPERTDLAIGGCWNEAIFSKACGRYVVQLDSDDLYRDENVLQEMVNKLKEGRYGMVVGSYTLVDMDLNEIPPGIVDHREWTDENGHNNALRINGFGAPRGFDTSLLRRIGFLNVSYGEDYGIALKICRKYRVGRIFNSLYLCRRWSGNTDSSLTVDEKNRNDAFKDSLRTEEIMARILLNKKGGGDEG